MKSMRPAMHAKNGPWLKILGDSQWYGHGYCGICGDDDVVPVAVRWWDPDDGWKYGVLCWACGNDVSPRGPNPDDYALATRGKKSIAEDKVKIDLISDILDDDCDGTLSFLEEIGIINSDNFE